MSYNLLPLITILEQILNPKETRWIVIDYNKPQLESLLQKAASLNQILEKSSIPIPESLESRIRDAAHQAEDVIERTTVNKLLSWSRPVTFSFSKKGLREVMEEFDSVMEQVVEGNSNTPKKMSTPSSFLPDPPSSKKVVVGIDDDLLQLKDRLTGHERKLEIVPITGMGGIGKTTLARKLYEDPLILSHFDVCAWTTISQDINVRAVLLGLLRRPNEYNDLKDFELKETLHKRLFGRRYLIVLDDMWSTGSWDAIRRFLPDNNNGSRIVLTTRESYVAKDVGTQSLQHEVQLLNESESWKLVCQIVFGEEEDCPDIAILEGIGRKIAGVCGGLPLAINVIGGLLSKAERSITVWESIGKDVSTSIAAADDNGFSNVLSLSYNHLPNHMKPCFLYLGAFPEDYEIKGSRLIYMWMGEGLVKSNGDKSLEEEAEDYLKALVERNLVMVTRKRSNGKAMEFGMHDLLRDLCMRKASEKKFFHVINERVDGALALALPNKVRRVSVQTSNGILEGVDAEMSLARCFICCFTGGVNLASPTPAFLVLRLVRVLDVFAIKFKEFPREILQLVNLRYLAFCCDSNIPGEISRLVNLQTLIGEIDGNCTPTEIWEMCELKHLILDTIIYIEEGCLKFDMYEKLQMISNVRCNRSLIRMGFFKTIPNIKKLGISCLELPCTSEEEEVDLSHLHKLQTLRCESDLNKDGCRFLPTVRFPPTLRKLTLCECVIFPRVLTTLCALPNLEVLSFPECEFENGVFEATEADVFRSLQYLLLDKLKNLVRWRADETNFPTLQKLLIMDCLLLEEIPSGIGDISTLQEIEVYDCNNPSLEASAREIEKVQQDDFDNFDLQVNIYNES